MDYKYPLSNLKPDIIDQRDYIFSSNNIDLPKSCEYLDFVGEIENQLNTGSCVANATVSSLELLAQRNGLQADYSRLFVYYNLRAPYENLNEKDTGAYLRDGFKTVNQIGVPEEKYWDFLVNRVNLKPTQEAYEKASENKVVSYNRILKDENCITNLKSAVFNGFPIIIAMILDKSFYNMPYKFENQNYNGTNKQEEIIGSHAMSIVGYNDDLQAFYVENSWGSSWGDKGLFLLKYDVLLKDCHDIWCCTGFKDFKMDAKIKIKEPSTFEKVKDYFKNFKQNKSEIIFYAGLTAVLIINVWLFIA